MKLIIHNSLNNKSISIYNFDEDSTKTVESLYSDLNLDKNHIYLISDGKILKDNYSLIDYDNKIIEVRIRLKGGKGGFGSSLRLQQATKKQTKNFDACRDLQGRRLRKVNQERQLNEWRMKKAEEEKLLKKYIEGYNTNEEDLFKKIMNEKRNMDAIKKNQKFYEDNEKLKINIKKSIKIYLNKKRERNNKNGIIDEENIEKEKNDINNNKKKMKLKGIKKKVLKLKKIDEINNIIQNEKEENKEEDKQEEKNYINEIKKMENEEDLFDAILLITFKIFLFVYSL
jgi:hypothetical protein